MYSTGIGVNASQAKVNINIGTLNVFMRLMRQYLCGTEMYASIDRPVGTVH